MLLAQYERRGAKPEASAAANELSDLLRAGNGPFDVDVLVTHTSGNLRVESKQFVSSGRCPPELKDVFQALKRFAESRIPDPSEFDYVVVCEALMLSNTSGAIMKQLAVHVLSCHGKLNFMFEVYGQPGEYHEATIDYEGAIKALLERGDFPDTLTPSTRVSAISRTGPGLK